MKINTDKKNYINKNKDKKINTNIEKNNIDKKNTSNNNDNCPFFKKCGGCKYINLSYDEQLKKKEQILQNHRK